MLFLSLCLVSLALALPPISNDPNRICSCGDGMKYTCEQGKSKPWELSGGSKVHNIKGDWKAGCIKCAKYVASMRYWSKTPGYKCVYCYHNRLTGMVMYNDKDDTTFTNSRVKGSRFCGYGKQSGFSGPVRQEYAEPLRYVDIERQQLRSELQNRYDAEQQARYEVEAYRGFDSYEPSRGVSCAECHFMCKADRQCKQADCPHCLG